MCVISRSFDRGNDVDGESCTSCPLELCDMILSVDRNRPIACRVVKRMLGEASNRLQAFGELAKSAKFETGDRRFLTPSVIFDLQVFS